MGATSRQSSWGSSLDTCRLAVKGPALRGHPQRPGGALQDSFGRLVPDLLVLLVLRGIGVWLQLRHRARDARRLWLEATTARDRRLGEEEEALERRTREREAGDDGYHRNVLPRRPHGFRLG